MVPRTTTGMLVATQLLALMRQVSFQARKMVNWDYTFTYLRLTRYTIYDCHLIMGCQTARRARTSEHWTQQYTPVIPYSSTGAHGML